MLSNSWEYWEIMRSIVKFTTKLSIAGLAVLMGMSAGFANTLSEIQIDALDTGYGIVLKTDETAQIKKTISADNNKLTLQLKDVEVSPDLNTVYNNVTNLDNVTVTPAGKGDIKIIFKGENIADSKILFDKQQSAATLPATPAANESISLSAPVSSYTPVYNQTSLEEEVQDDQTANPQVNQMLTQMHVSREMLVNAKTFAKKVVNKAASGDINLITILGVIFIIASMLFRPKKKPVQKQQSLSELLSKPKSSAQMEREIALNRRMADNMVLSRPDGLAAVNPLNAGYGIRAYQNSQKNPYTTNIEPTGISGIPRRRPMHQAASSMPQNQQHRQIVRQSVAPIKRQPVINQPVSTPVATKPQTLANPKMQTTKSTPSDLDSVKFLESITKIYEKNGRADLAKGLKENLRKAQAHTPKRAF